MPGQAAIISLSGLHEPWRDILHLGTRLDFPRSAHHYPATSDCFYFIAKGRVRLSYVDEHGGDNVVLIFGPGCIFNETDVLTKENSEVSFRVLEATQAYRFSGSLLHDPTFIRTYPQLLHCMLVATAIKFSSSNTAMLRMKHGSPTLRLCRYLRQLALCHNNACVFPLDMTQLELATVLAVHRVSLFRSLTRLRREGVVRAFSRKCVELESLEVLEAFLRKEEDADDL